MSDWGSKQAQAVDTQPGADTQHSSASAGSLLKAAREAQGLHIAALAVSLKVPVKKIELLEANRFDELPDAVFVRGLAASIGRALKIDTSDILSKLPQTNTPRLSHDQQSINTPFRMPADGPQPVQFLALLKRPIVWAVMALLLGAMVLIFVPDIVQKTSDWGAHAVSSVGGAPGKSLPSMPDAQAGASEGREGTVLGAGSAVSSTLDAATTTMQTTQAISPLVVAPKLSATAPTSSPKLLSPTLVITPLLDSATNASADPASLVVFKATGQSWIEVSDVRGKTTLRKMLQAGESVGTSGALPLDVTVGSADQTQVWVRGKPFEGGRLRNNVLRFEVR